MTDPLRDFASWVIDLDEPDNEDRRTVTLTQIIDRARTALNAAEFYEDDEDPAAAAAAYEAGEKGLTKQPGTVRDLEHPDVRRSLDPPPHNFGYLSLPAQIQAEAEQAIVEMNHDFDCCAYAAGRRTRGGPDHCGLCGKQVLDEKPPDD